MQASPPLINMRLPYWPAGCVCLVASRNSVRVGTGLIATRLSRTAAQPHEAGHGSMEQEQDEAAVEIAPTALPVRSALLALHTCINGTANMRLLDARTLGLVDITDDSIPPYAILSHTWGDEEITIQQLRRLGGCSQTTLASPQTLDKKRRAIVLKKGYIKISGAAQLAVSRGLDYIWVDTCCIDKTSSAELSEAINSMYLWYEKSAECYAYLSDVEPVLAAADATAFHETLRRSRWFTRGWTLQELIAPKIVLFYAKDWGFLGQKHTPPEFTKAISDITNIDQEVLNGRIDPLQLSVSARMAWASHRNTTRLEDTAYCLMGLFQVNMPLLYGEGRRAFARLQEEIIQRTDDQSIFAWNSFDDQDEDPDALFGLLAQSPSQFKLAGSLQVLPPLPIYASAPSSMTNQGIRVQLYIQQRASEDQGAMEEDYYAILDCVKRDGDVYQCPALYLRRLSEDQYGRLRPKSQLFMPPPSATFLPMDGYRSVYVRQQPIYYHLPQFRLSPFNVESSLGSSDGVQYRLFDKYPTQNWNSATMTLKAQYSRKLQAMGIFRFQSVEKMDDKVDVVVGLRRLNTMEWEGWCFQLLHRDVSLEHTFHEVNKKIESIITGSSTIEITSKTLRDSLGEDSCMTSSATVEGIQLQGRLYISIQVTQTAEIQTDKQLLTVPAQQIVMSKSNQILNSTSANSGARALTEIYCLASSSSYTLDEYTPLNWVVQPVRSRYSSNGKGTIRGDFLKPIHEFINVLRHEKKATDLSLTDHLALALFSGDAQQAGIILAYKKANIEVPTEDYHGLAPLHWAVVGGSRNCIMLLLKEGVNTRRLTRRGLSAIHVSVLCNNKVFDDLARLRGNPEREQLANARTNHFSETPLHLAAASTPDNEVGLTFFKEFMDWSLEFIGLTPRNAFDETPLHRAAAGDSVGAIRALATRSYYCYVDNGDQYGRTPLWHAAAAGALKAITALVRLGASVDLTDDLGRSPLHAASRGGHHEAVSLLLEMGARTDIETNVLNLLPMDLAVMFGFSECLKLLLDSRWRIVTQENMDRTLLVAASFGTYECASLLCQHGANPFVTFENYLRYEDGHAVVVEEEADAHAAALAERELHIVHYFDTSDTCRYHRELRHPPADNISNKPPAMENPPAPPSFSAPVGAPPAPGAAAPVPGALPPTAVSAPVFVPGSGPQYQYAPEPPTQSGPAGVPSSGPSSGSQYQYAPKPPAQSAPAFTPGSGQQYQYVPRPPTQSAPAAVPGSGQPSQNTPLYGNAPSYASPAYGTPSYSSPEYGRTTFGSSPAYGNTPSYNSPAYGSTTFGSRPSASSSFAPQAPQAPQQALGKYQSPSRLQSTNLPARASAGAYAPIQPTAPTQSERLQEMVNPYEPYKAQAPNQIRPATYSSPQAADTPNQGSSVAARNKSVPAYRSVPYQSSEARIQPVVAGYQQQAPLPSIVDVATPLASPPASPEENPQKRDTKRESTIVEMLRSRRS
ncbi:hypothetical protein THAR02_04378 [Trichoderma harzianum]|uniref:Uncharacterized protein n=1 Tax=Trichoderma harzianum TaxID=5544 RepID=A0A0F9XG65_TRIHA|nr:hypothetical protein THAR02_04378 [Trichoderma harzianum]